MSTARIFQIVMDEECNYQQSFVFLEPLTGLPFDLTGYRGEMQVRVGPNGDLAQAYSNYNVALVYNTDSNALVLGGTAGTVNLSIPYADTYHLQYNQGEYSIVLIAPTGQRIEFLKGFFIILPNASKLGNSTLVNATGGSSVPSPNNQGAQAQDSNTPGVPNPTTGEPPPQPELNMVEKLDEWLQSINY